MIVSRVLSFILRGLEFCLAVIILAFVSHLIWRGNETGNGTRGRYIYTDIVAATSTLFSLIWLIPCTWSMIHYPMDFLISIAWFAAFGALYDWIHQNGVNCSGVFGIWTWDGNTHDLYCHEYRAVEGLSLVSAVFWLISALLSIHVFHRVRPQRRGLKRTNGGV